MNEVNVLKALQIIQDECNSSSCDECGFNKAGDCLLGQELFGAPSDIDIEYLEERIDE